MKALLGYSRCRHTRHALERVGFHVVSCDLLPANHPDHYQGDIADIIHDDWDFAVLHPMCTYLTGACAWAFNDPDFERYPEIGYHQKVKPGTLTGAARRDARDEAIQNFKMLDALPFPKIIENPARGFISTYHRKPDQIIHPHEFGDDASKATGLWLSPGLPKMKPTKHVTPRIVDGKPRWSNQTDSGQNNLTPSADRWLERSATYPGIANAIGDQIARYVIKNRSTDLFS